MANHRLILDRFTGCAETVRPRCACGHWIGTPTRRPSTAGIMYRRHVELWTVNLRHSGPPPRPVTPADKLPEVLR